jgi:hypothetical protein
MKVLRYLAILACLSFGANAFAGATYSNIENMGTWQSCSACAGAGGNGSVAPYSMVQSSSPSMDGHSAQFNLGGSHPYSNALWWKQLGANSSAHNFTYDLFFYLKTPSAAQALEFDVNQSTGGHKYIFGTECAIKDGQWKIYNSHAGWENTGIHCSVPSAYQWHHLTWEFQRTSGNQVKFISMTLDGSKHYLNRTYSPQASGSSEINVAFQMDGDSSQQHYSAWLDEVKLSYF